VVSASDLLFWKHGIFLRNIKVFWYTIFVSVSKTVFSEIYIKILVNKSVNEIRHIVLKFILVYFFCVLHVVLGVAFFCKMHLKH